MSRKGRGLSEDEDKLWRGVLRAVKPLRKRAPKIEPPSPPPPPGKMSPRLARASSTIKEASPPPKSKAPPPLASLDRRAKQQLARGAKKIDARLDLHGHRQDEAHDALSRFLQRSQDKGASVVLVITGKGRGGDSGAGVLRRQVPQWLSLPAFRDYVIGFDVAAISHGGEGALYVRLRKRRG